jgi:hypothetical protein
MAVTIKDSAKLATLSIITIMALLTTAVTFSELPSARSMALINSFAQEDEVEEEDPEEVEDEVEEEDPEEVEDEVEEEDPEEVGRVEVFHVNGCPQNRELDDGFCCPENYHAGYELNPDRKKCVRNDLIIMDDRTTCPNGVVVPVTEDCPDDTTTCPNGAVVAADESCPDDLIIPPKPNIAPPPIPQPLPSPVLTYDPLSWIIAAIAIGGSITAYAKIRSGLKQNEEHDTGTVEVGTEGGVEAL